MFKLGASMESDRRLAVFVGLFGVLGLLQSLYFLNGWLLLQALIIFAGAYVLYVGKPFWSLLVVFAGVLALVPFVPETPVWPSLVLLGGWIAYWAYRIYRIRSDSASE